MVGNKKRQLILAIMLIYSVLSCQAQQFFQYDSSTEKVSKSVKILNEEIEDSSIPLSSAYGTICYHYCFLKNQQSIFSKNEDFQFLFRLIERDRDKYIKRYKTFLKKSVHCFSQQEYISAKTYLIQNTLDLKDPISYDLISLYQLDSYKDTLNQMINPNWFKDIEVEIKTSPTNRNISTSLVKAGYPYVALANLGDKSVEDSLLTLIVNHIKTFRTENIDRTEAWRQNEFYKKIITQILMRLWSKESLYRTIDMIDNCLLVNSYLPEAYDVTYTPLCWNYANGVIGNKLHPNYEDYFSYNNRISMGPDKYFEEAQNKRINKIKNAILQDDLELLKVTEEDIRSGMIPSPKNVKYAWSNIYTLWENEKK